MVNHSVRLADFSTFGDLLKYLRKRAQLSQRELAIATGYSESQISRLEGNLRGPNQADLMPLFIPALEIQDEPEIIQRLINLAQRYHGHANEPDQPDHVLAKGYAHNLPIQLTSFIGREKEIIALQKYIISNHARLVTLTGSGGVGKTRLAIRVTEDLLGYFEDGVWMVELAHITNTDRLPHSIAAALGLKESAAQPMIDILAHYLNSRKLLIVLDNCEHLVTGCAEIVDRLLHACPRLVFLATSREPLQIAGEQTYRVPSLAVPGPYSRSPVEDLTRFEAICLFCERAAAAWQGFEITAQNALAVVEICRRLDGIPLAIELAASRVSVMSPEQILTRLDQCFRLLSTGPRTGLSRHQTLRASIDWSYNLLSSTEQLLFKRLSVFSGSLTLEAAEGVCSYDGIEDVEVLNLLASLVNKSLVSVLYETARKPRGAEHGNRVRYRMLETVRQYAAEKLTDNHLLSTHPVDELKGHHLTYYARLFEPTGYELLGPKQIDWVELLISELENIRAALDWVFGSNPPGDIEAGVKLASSPLYFWYFFGLGKEAYSWLASGLKYLAGQMKPSPVLLGKTYKTAAASLFTMGDLQKSREYLGKSIALLRPLGPSYDLADALIWLVFVGPIQPTDAEVLKNEAVKVARQVGDAGLLATCLFMGPGTHHNLKEAAILLEKHGEQLFLVDSNRILKMLAWSDGDYALARCHLQKTLSINQKYSMKTQITWDLMELASLAYCECHYSQMEADAKACLNTSEEIGFWKMISWAHYYLGVAARRQLNPDQAGYQFKEGLVLADEYRFEDLLLMNLAGLAGVAITRGRLIDAVKLLGIAERHGMDMFEYLPRAEFKRDQAEAQLQLSEEKFLAACEEGREMTIEQALQIALEV